MSEKCVVLVPLSRSQPCSWHGSASLLRVNTFVRADLQADVPANKVTLGRNVTKQRPTIEVRSLKSWTDGPGVSQLHGEDAWQQNERWEKKELISSAALSGITLPWVSALSFPGKCNDSLNKLPTTTKPFYRLMFIHQVVISYLILIGDL